MEDSTPKHESTTSDLEEELLLFRDIRDSLRRRIEKLEARIAEIEKRIEGDDYHQAYLRETE